MTDEHALTAALVNTLKRVAREVEARQAAARPHPPADEIDDLLAARTLEQIP
jgi:hypothetical protein